MTRNVRVLDPDTCWVAERLRQVDRSARLRGAIIGVLREHGPATDRELRDRVEEHRTEVWRVRDREAPLRGLQPIGTADLIFSVDEMQVRKRRGELRDAGLVVDSGERGAPSGRPMIRWGLSDVAR